MQSQARAGTGPYRPLSPWGYVLYSLLFAVPVVGWLALAYFSFSRSNFNRRAFARSAWCWLLVLALGAGAAFFSVPRALRDSLAVGWNAVRDTLSRTGVGVTPAFAARVDGFAAFFEEYRDFLRRLDLAQDKAALAGERVQWAQRLKDVQAQIGAAGAESLTVADRLYLLDALTDLVQRGIMAAPG
ncbi:MAG TPA: hypothetical protein VLA21_04715 [Candidatus Limnocylindria bacterium]|nr:hypothetical protein [Candidatus Limnocylindria bacterium]